jgi:tetratricopeptide (TPR) repeat protein
MGHFAAEPVDNATQSDGLLCIQVSTHAISAEASLAHALILRGVGAAVRGDAAQAKVDIDRGIELFEQRGEVLGVGIGLVYLARLAEQREAFAEAEQLATRGLQTMQSIHERYGDIPTSHCLASVAWQRGNLAQAEEHLQRGLAAAEALGNQLKVAEARHLQAWVALARGDLDIAADYLRHELAIGDNAGMESVVASAWLGFGLLAGEREDWPEAVRWGRGALRRARAVGDTWLVAGALLVLARARMHTRRLATATLLLEHSRALASGQAWPWPSVQRNWAWPARQAALLVAEIEYGRGQFAAARASAEEAFELAALRGRQLDQAAAQCLLGRTHLAQGDGERAAMHLRSAVALQLEMGALLAAVRTRSLLAQAVTAST